MEGGRGRGEEMGKREKGRKERERNLKRKGEIGKGEHKTNSRNLKKERD